MYSAFILQSVGVLQGPDHSTTPLHGLLDKYSLTIYFPRYAIVFRQVAQSGVGKTRRDIFEFTTHS